GRGGGGLWGALWEVVKDRLEQRWSPVQIAAWLRVEFPDRPEQWVSHETIYRAIFFQARGGMRQELARQVALRSGRTGRRPQSRGAGPPPRDKPPGGGPHLSPPPPPAPPPPGARPPGGGA